MGCPWTVTIGSVALRISTTGVIVMVVVTVFERIQSILRRTRIAQDDRGYLDLRPKSVRREISGGDVEMSVRRQVFRLR